MGVFNSTINFAAISAAMATSTAAWMNGTVRIIDPNVGDSVWDVVTNTETGGEPTVLWEGAARIQHLVKDRLAEAGSNDKSHDPDHDCHALDCSRCHACPPSVVATPTMAVVPCPAANKYASELHEVHQTSAVAGD